MSSVPVGDQRPAGGVKLPGATVTGPGELISPGSSSNFLCECWGLSQTQFLWLMRQALYCLNHLPGPLIPSFRSFVKVWSVSLHQLLFVTPGFGRQAGVTTFGNCDLTSVGDSCWVWRPPVNVCKSLRADTLRIDRWNFHTHKLSQTQMCGRKISD